MSNNKKFIFIHIAKSGGTSVMHVFLPYARILDRLVYEYNRTKKLTSIISDRMGWNDDGRRQFTGFHKHATATEVKEKLGKRYEKYYVFSVVRNPYDLLVSRYFYRKRSKKHRSYHIVKDMEFKEFLRWEISCKPARQIDFLMDSQQENFIVDYVGHYERLKEDISNILNHLNLPPVQNIPHKNPSPNREKTDYKDYYDEESIYLVAGYFHKDLELLGYSFEGFDKDFRMMSEA